MEREYEVIKPNRNTVTFVLVATLLSMVGLFFLGAPLGLPYEVAYAAAGIAAVCFVALFFVPGDEAEKCEDVPHDTMSYRPDYDAIGKISRQLSDMRGFNQKVWEDKE